MKNNYKYYAFYLILAILAYWQVSFFQNMLKWDMIDVHMPWRMFITESIMNGHFPLWNPYQDFGYPIHADMRSIWTPEIWLISLFGGYSVYSFSVLFIFYASVAGIGMKLLSGYFLKDEKAAFFSGLIYMLSGYLTAHAQELYTINSFALVPIIIYQYLRFKDSLTYQRALLFIFFIFILLTSGYQAHSFMLLYLLIALLLCAVIEFFKEKRIDKIKRFLLFHVGFVVLIVALLLPIIISAYQVFPFVQRLNSGVGLETLSILSFSPQSLISLLLPFASIRDIDFFNTDLSMTNLYFGVIALVFLLVSITKIRRKSIFFVIFIFGLVSLIASFGDYTPFREMLFKYVPFMNMFRGSAFFRLYTLIAFVISAGFVFSDIKRYKKSLLLAISAVSLVLVVFIVFSLQNLQLANLSFFNPDLKWLDILAKESSFYENIFVQGIIQLLFLFVFCLLLIKNRASYRNILGLVILDLFLAVQLNVYTTTVSKFEPKSVNDYLSSQPAGFPVPERLKISESKDKQSSFGPLWRNTNIFSKRVSGDAFNSFFLDKTEIFRDSLFVLRDSISENELLYFSTDIQALSNINRITFTSKTLFIEDSIVNNLKIVSSDEPNEYSITEFSPTKIVVRTKVLSESLLTLIQTNYPGWHAFIDGVEVDIIESNTMFLSVVAPVGNHELEFVYENQVLFKVFCFSSVLFILLLLLVLRIVYKGSENKNKRVIVAVLSTALILFIVWKQYKYRSQISDINSELDEIITECSNELLVLDKDIQLDYPRQVIIDFGKKFSLTKLEQILTSNYADSVTIIWKNKKVAPEILNFLNTQFAKSELILDAGNSKVLKFSKKTSELYSYLQDFELDKKAWNYNINLITEDTLANHLLKYNGLEFACSYSFTLEKSEVLNNISALVDIHSSVVINPLLVISIEKEGESILWLGSEFKGFYKKDNKSNLLFNSIDLNSIEYPDNAEVKIYIWNKQKEDFSIDNFRVQIY